MCIITHKVRREAFTCFDRDYKAPNAWKRNTISVSAVGEQSAGCEGGLPGTDQKCPKYKHLLPSIHVQPVEYWKRQYEDENIIAGLRQWPGTLESQDF